MSLASRVNEMRLENRILLISNGIKYDERLIGSHLLDSNNLG